MRIADIKYNDIVDGDGVCLSVWFQGCPHKCKGCHILKHGILMVDMK